MQRIGVSDLGCVFRRFSCEETMLTARIIWFPGEADDIGANSLQILATASRQSPTFFSGKSCRPLLSGLFYILGLRFNAFVSQREIAKLLGINENSVRLSYQKWLKHFPHLFSDITKPVKMGNGAKSPSPSNRIESCVRCSVSKLAVCATRQQRT